MRVYLWGFLLLFFVSCEHYESDRFQPLSKDDKDLLRFVYEDGDTLAYLYSDSAKSDTFHFVVQPIRAYLNSYSMPETNFSFHDEINEREFISTDGKQKLQLSVGNMEYGKETFSPPLYFYLRMPPFGYYRMSLPENTSSAKTYRIYNDYYRQDSIYLTYSSDSGVHSLHDFEKGYKLEKLP